MATVSLNKTLLWALLLLRLQRSTISMKSRGRKRQEGDQATGVALPLAADDVAALTVSGLMRRLRR